MFDPLSSEYEHTKQFISIIYNNNIIFYNVVHRPLIAIPKLSLTAQLGYPVLKSIDTPSSEAWIPCETRTTNKNRQFHTYQSPQFS